LSKNYHRCKRILNYHTRICLVCGELVSEHQPEIHHVEIYPSIGIFIHSDCHFRIHHEDKYTNLRPMMSHQQVEVAQKIVKNKEKIKQLITLNNQVSKLHRKIKL
jgi:hypothetical protein